MSAEIEVKYRVHDEPALLAALARRGITLSPPVLQDDQAYAPASWRPGASRIGVTFARLRQQDDRCVFTTKTPVDNLLACREFETEVGDREQMHAAIVAMGYAPTVRVVKTRRTAQIDDFALCVDLLVGAGVFLEVEAVAATMDDMPRVQDRLARWVEGLGVAVERTGATYDQVVSQAAPMPV